MTEQHFLAQCERILDAIDHAAEHAPVNIDTERQGHVLTLEFDDGSRIVVNGNVPMREMWVAARSGGFHFRERDGHWHDTRDEAELFTRLSALATEQAGEAVDLGARP